MGQVSLDPPVPMNTWMPEIPLPGMNRMLDLVLCSPGAVLPYSVQHPGISFFSYCSMFTRCSAAIFSTASRYQFLHLFYYRLLRANKKRINLIFFSLFYYPWTTAYMHSNLENEGVVRREVHQDRNQNSLDQVIFFSFSLKVLLFSYFL